MVIFNPVPAFSMSNTAWDKSSLLVTIKTTSELKIPGQKVDMVSSDPRRQAYVVWTPVSTYATH